MLLVVGGVMGFVSVAFGAYVEHAMREAVEPEVFRNLMTAIRYNQIHAVATLAVGLTLLRGVEGRAGRLLGLAGWGFVAGALLFSGGIYLSALFNAPELTYAAPFGGVTLMLAWLAAAAAGLAARRAGS